MSATPGAAQSAAFDLSAFARVFFDEAAEHLASMESMLVELDPAQATADELNAIFRAAHSIKGGAATFGFKDMAEVTHELESLLDRARKQELALTPPMVDALLAAGDQLAAQLKVHRGEGGRAPDSAPVCQRIRAFLDGNVAMAPLKDEAKSPSALGESRGEVPALHVLDIRIKLPKAKKAIASLEAALAELNEVPAERPKKLAKAIRYARIETTLTVDEVRESLAFVVPEKTIEVEAQQPSPSPLGEGGGEGPSDIEGFGFFADVPDTPPAIEGFGLFDDTPVQERRANPAAREREPTPARRDGAENLSIRVSVDKVDLLINQVGELVITQAMLAQAMASLDPIANAALLTSLRDLERNTRGLQESVMSIRMMPIAFVFNRFPRMARELAAQLNKQVAIVMDGESTELDKGVIEKLSDPLTHLVRNSIDHGIEVPEKRIAAGKNPQGTVTLRAANQGGSIVVQIIDDGGGLSRERILAKARERGFDLPDDAPDGDVFGLIFEAGFSTAEKVTDVSGRGVGMDVVKRNIAALGGVVEIDSRAGQGTCITVRLPLTLAIMDGMSVAVGDVTYILPLASVVESMQPKEGAIKPVAGRGRVLQVRDEFLPVISMRERFPTEAPPPEGATEIMVLVEADGVKAALQVDALVGQQQVVVKSIETNYRKVPGLSGATILGDGTVAVILDVPALVKQAH